MGGARRTVGWVARGIVTERTYQRGGSGAPLVFPLLFLLWPTGAQGAGGTHGPHSIVSAPLIG